MTSYIAIADSEIDPESPVTTGLMTKLRDNPIAIAEGASGAPRFSRKAIAPGGSGADGAVVNATTLTGAGIFEFTGITRTTALAVPYISLIRVKGNVTLSNTMSATGLWTSDLDIASAAFHACVGNSGATTGTFNAGRGGGASVGAGGNGWTESTGNQDGLGGAARDLSTLNRAWALLRPIVGGIPGYSAASGQIKGGGSIILIVEGNMVLTGGTISADGTAGESATGNQNNPGGGGGGSVIVICTGTITDGTFTANGGAGGFCNPGGANNDYSGGGGGGGYVAVVASAYAGSQTLQANGGAAGTNATAGAAGYTTKVTLAEDIINGLLLR